MHPVSALLLFVVFWCNTHVRSWTSLLHHRDSVIKTRTAVFKPIKISVVLLKLWAEQAK